MNPIIRNFIDPELAVQLGKEFMQFARYYRCKGDLFEIKGGGIIQYKHHMPNWKPAVEILCNKCHLVSETSGLSVVPTYCYVREYVNGDPLIPHRDRPECQVSISLHLWGDTEWDLIVDGEPYLLTPGDAVLYYGCDQEHNREPYTGQNYIQMFLHYVDINDKFAHRFFGNYMSLKDTDEPRAYAGKAYKFIKRYNSGKWRNVDTET